jgi:hypothetical protein
MLGPLMMLALLGSAGPFQECPAPAISKLTTVDAVISHFASRNKSVLTFVGYSGADYQDRAAMLKQASAILDRFDPVKTIVNVGATIDGIGAVYEVARRKGFETAGIVSSQARTAGVTLAPCAGTVFFVEDASWGGRLDRSTELSPTSRAIVRVSDHLAAIGGGDIARDEFMAARRLGKKTEFIAADMNHEIARDRAAKNKQPAPTDFRGTLGAALAGGR